MSKSRNVEAKLIRLRSLRKGPAAAAHVAELRTLLRDQSNLVVAEAAEIVGSRLVTELAPELVAAFDRFMVKPAETDKQCRALIAIVEALNKIEYDKEDIFLRGIRHVQKEFRWGAEPPEEDAAAPLRADCAFGLVRINHRDVALLLADLLADPEKIARVGAARALGESRAPAAIPLLRYKARIGDKEPDVTAECLAALMIADPKESLPFVAEFLRSPSEAIQEGAALALGESRRPDALEILKQHWPSVRQGSPQEVLLLAISMTRLPAALDFLMEIIVADDRGAALTALSALAIHRHNKTLHERVAVAVAKKRDMGLTEQFKKKFEEKAENRNGAG